MGSLAAGFLIADRAEFCNFVKYVVRGEMLGVESIVDRVEVTRCVNTWRRSTDEAVLSFDRRKRRGGERFVCC